ncbi:Y+L amino acid transporter 2-like [Tropilaelaps mercedesae]|uniref:Y+L amino acid transporter 2-like n=1 Tax=Tropilaelaps mercedesae TaxID=418985 RepID=A0A1V9Y2Z6_9ACAR|nr:Y+L amino acid transporter 2-like [Tropilaelaps mercedesae]
MPGKEKGDYSSVPGKEGVGKDDVGQDDGVICLKPKMTLVNGITVIVGSIIGSGIFVSPRGVLENTGSVMASIVVWVICGLFSMVGAYCYAELGCIITKTGADYAYIMEAFGPFVAFLRLWVECIIVRPCSQAIVALTFSFYVLRPIFPYCEPPDDAVRALAVVCIRGLCGQMCYYCLQRHKLVVARKFNGQPPHDPTNITEQARPAIEAPFKGPDR